MTRSIARISRARGRLLAEMLEHHHAVQNVPIGLAMPLPVMSKAEPWIGSNIEGTCAPD